MRRVVVLATLAACRTVSNEPRATGLPEASTKPVASVVVDAGPPPEEPLAWGARPPKEGALFPVVDGECSRAEIWPTKGSALYTYGGRHLARLADDGVVVDGGLEERADGGDVQHLVRGEPWSIEGTWPAPVLMHTDAHGARTRDLPDLWTHEANGWRNIASHREKDEPSYSTPILFKGWIVAGRWTWGGPDERKDASVRAWPYEKDAPAIPNLAQLARGGVLMSSFAATESTLYGFGSLREDGASKGVVRSLKDGKVTDIAEPELGRPIGVTNGALVFVSERKVHRLTGDKLTTVSPKMHVDARIRGSGIAPNGDVWIVTSKQTVHVLHGDEVTTSTLPASTPPPPSYGERGPVSGGRLAGVEHDDPWAIGDGVLFHHVNGAWEEVKLPPSPFSVTKKYRAETLQMPAKGDLVVNASAIEKGPGWSGTLIRRAVFRTKRPREVLRCNESDGGPAFMSFAPIADDTCKTPFAVLLRIGWNVGTKDAQYIFNRQADFAPVRGALKGMESLGPTVDLVEFVAGSQRYLGARVPSVAAGNELAAAVVKKVKIEFHTHHPEVVCGAPREERVLSIDVATGAITP